MTNNNVAHRWANRNYSRGGRLNGASMFATEHNQAVYSYGEHFMIARHTGNEDFPLLLTNRSGSVSTSKHVGFVMAATSHVKPKFYCQRPEHSFRDIYVMEIMLLRYRTNEIDEYKLKVQARKMQIENRAAKIKEVMDEI